MQLWQFWNEYHDKRPKIKGKEPNIVIRVMCTEEEETDRDEGEPFLCRCVLLTVVDLLPHVQVVISTGVVLEWDAFNIVKHKI